MVTYESRGEDWVSISPKKPNISWDADDDDNRGGNLQPQPKPQPRPQSIPQQVYDNIMKLAKFENYMNKNHELN